MDFSAFPNSYIMSEMGMRPDGQVLYGDKEERKGLGSDPQDVYIFFFS